MTPHVPLPRSLQLERRYRHVAEYLALFDADLRLRKSAERPNLYVLERRLRNRPAANLGMQDLSDLHVQARDGYVHIASVHPWFLDRPWRIVQGLKESGADLWDQGGSGRVADELDYEEQWQRISRKRRRLQMFREIALDGYDLLNRININGERSRLSVAGRARGDVKEPHDSPVQASTG